MSPSAAMAFDLTGRVVLVTGAAGGLGSAVARAAVDAGATVALCDLPGERLESLREQLAREGSSVIAVAADLSAKPACEDVVRSVVAQTGGLHCLVACSGVVQTKALLDLSEDEWLRMININLNGIFFSVQAAGAVMIESGGSMVLFSSVAGRSGRPLAAHYAAAKTGVLSLTKSAAAAFAPNVRVNAVCPGVFLTEMWDRILEDREEMFGEEAAHGYLNKVVAAAPLGRAGEPSEIASAVMFLLSDAASYITGQALNVDGGLEMD